MKHRPSMDHVRVVAFSIAVYIAVLLMALVLAGIIP